MMDFILLLSSGYIQVRYFENKRDLITFGKYASQIFTLACYKTLLPADTAPLTPICMNSARSVDHVTRCIRSRAACIDTLRI